MIHPFPYVGPSHDILRMWILDTRQKPFEAARARATKIVHSIQPKIVWTLRAQRIRGPREPERPMGVMTQWFIILLVCCANFLRQQRQCETTYSMSRLFSSRDSTETIFVTMRPPLESPTSISFRRYSLGIVCRQTKTSLFIKNSISADVLGHILGPRPFVLCFFFVSFGRARESSVIMKWICM